jgi:Sodium/hydrogen exchanger family
VSSSGVIAKLLQDAPRDRKERPLILSVLVMEDLMMAMFLPIIGGLLIGGSDWTGMVSALLAVAGVGVFLMLATRVDVGLSRLLFSRSDEALLLTILGLTLAVAGIAERVQVSAAVGALIVGIVLAGPAAKNAHALLSPQRDLFAALFFGFFGLSIDPSSMVPVLVPAILIALVTAVTKLATGVLSTSSRVGKIGRRSHGNGVDGERGVFDSSSWSRGSRRFGTGTRASRCSVRPAARHSWAVDSQSCGRCDRQEGVGPPHSYSVRGRKRLSSALRESKQNVSFAIDVVSLNPERCLDPSSHSSLIPGGPTTPHFE